MNDEIGEFVQKAKAKGLNDEQIVQKLKDHGWSEQDANKALGKDDDLVVPAPPTALSQTKSQTKQYDANNPIPVVNNLSTKGFEYSIMFLSLWAVALSTSILINSIISNGLANNSTDYYNYNDGLDAFWTTVLVVFAPILVIMFLRLKKQELADPTQLKDPSRRRLSHFTQFGTFVTGACILIYFIYSLISGNVGGDGDMSFLELILHVIFTLAVTGTIFAYYWREEHKSNLRPN